MILFSACPLCHSTITGQGMTTLLWAPVIVAGWEHKIIFEIPLIWISKSLVWLSSSLERQLGEVFRNMDSNWGFKHQLFLCCSCTLASSWDDEVIYCRYISKLFLTTKLNFYDFLALYWRLRFKGNRPSVAPIFVKSNVWLQWIIDKAMLMKKPLMLILVFYQTCLIFENLVI